jgi:hypothetical protein
MASAPPSGELESSSVSQAPRPRIHILGRRGASRCPDQLPHGRDAPRPAGKEQRRQDCLPAPVGCPEGGGAPARGQRGGTSPTFDRADHRDVNGALASAPSPTCNRKVEALPCGAPATPAFRTLSFGLPACPGQKVRLGEGPIGGAR